MSELNEPLRRAVAAELRMTVSGAVSSFAQELAQRGGDTVAAVLFYGSNRRTGDLDGVLDFYVLVDRLGDWHRGTLAALSNRALPPNVSFETSVGGAVPLSAKVAVLSLRQFQRGVRRESIDTTLWARFAQPLGLAWVRDEVARRQTVAAVAAAITTAGHWAALLGPERGLAEAYWRALFQRTYAAELRVEKSVGRAHSLVLHEPKRYARLLPLAWTAAAIDFQVRNKTLEPLVTDLQRMQAQRGWRLRHALGKPLNLARLAKASFTFENGADYIQWKVERHSGVQLNLSAWQRAHPLLAAPGVLWKLQRSRSLR